MMDDAATAGFGSAAMLAWMAGSLCLFFWRRRNVTSPDQRHRQLETSGGVQLHRLDHNASARSKDGDAELGEGAFGLQSTTGGNTADGPLEEFELGSSALSSSVRSKASTDTETAASAAGASAAGSIPHNLSRYKDRAAPPAPGKSSDASPMSSTSALPPAAPSSSLDSFSSVAPPPIIGSLTAVPRSGGGGVGGSGGGSSSSGVGTAHLSGGQQGQGSPHLPPFERVNVNTDVRGGRQWEEPEHMHSLPVYAAPNKATRMAVHPTSDAGMSTDSGPVAPPAAASGAVYAVVNKPRRPAGPGTTTPTTTATTTGGDSNSSSATASAAAKHVVPEFPLGHILGTHNKNTEGSMNNNNSSSSINSSASTSHAGGMTNNISSSSITNDGASGSRKAPAQQYEVYGNKESIVRSLVVPASDVQIMSTLDAGHFGEVLSGTLHDRSGGSDRMVPVAIKTLKMALEVSERTAFAQEMATLAQVHHPNIVRLLAVVLDPLMIVMEHVSEGSLHKYLAANDIAPMAVVYTLALQTATGLRYLQDRKIVHRDIAARNVLLDCSGPFFSVKVADLGLAVMSQRIQAKVKKRVPLPVRWTAPESLFNGEFSGASDVWSFGVFMFELTSACQFPYTAFEEDRAVLEAIRSGMRLTQMPNVPTSFYAIMQRCWRYAPAERPSFSELEALIQADYYDKCLIRTNSGSGAGGAGGQLPLQVAPTAACVVPATSAPLAMTAAYLLHKSQPLLADVVVPAGVDYVEVLPASQEYDSVMADESTAKFLLVHSLDGDVHVPMEHCGLFLDARRIFIQRQGRPVIMRTLVRPAQLLPLDQEYYQCVSASGAPNGSAEDPLGDLGILPPPLPQRVVRHETEVYRAVDDPSSRPVSRRKPPPPPGTFQQPPPPPPPPQRQQQQQQLQQQPPQPPVSPLRPQRVKMLEDPGESNDTVEHELPPPPLVDGVAGDCYEVLSNELTWPTDEADGGGSKPSAAQVDAARESGLHSPSRPQPKPRGSSLASSSFSAADIAADTSSPKQQQQQQQGNEHSARSPGLLQVPPPLAAPRVRGLIASAVSSTSSSHDDLSSVSHSNAPNTPNMSDAEHRSHRATAHGTSIPATPSASAAGGDDLVTVALTPDGSRRPVAAPRSRSQHGGDERAPVAAAAVLALPLLSSGSGGVSPAASTPTLQRAALQHKNYRIAEDSGLEPNQQALLLDWLHTDISREQTEQSLAGCEAGTFVVRVGRKGPVMSVFCGETIMHARLGDAPGDGFVLTDRHKQPAAHASLGALIACLRTNRPEPAAAVPVLLRNVAPLPHLA